MAQRFWNFLPNDTLGGVELFIDGVIEQDEANPTLSDFRAQLSAVQGDLTVYINSIGGNVFLGAEVYYLLKAHAGKVTVKITGMAASAASVIAMAGDEILISPVGSIMVHNVSGEFGGNQYDAAQAYALLQEADEALVALYAARTGKRPEALRTMLKVATTMSGQTAVDEGFADGLIPEAVPAGSRAPVRARYQASAYDARALTAMLRQGSKDNPLLAQPRLPAHTHHSHTHVPQPQVYLSGDTAGMSLRAVLEQMAKSVQPGTLAAGDAAEEKARRTEISRRAGLVASLYNPDA